MVRESDGQQRRSGASWVMVGGLGRRNTTHGLLKDFSITRWGREEVSENRCYHTEPAHTHATRGTPILLIKLQKKIAENKYRETSGRVPCQREGLQKISLGDIVDS